MNQQQQGFSLIEILVVITIIGMLIAVSGGAYLKYIAYGEMVQTRAAITQLEEYASDYNDRRGDYPPSQLKDLGVVSTGDEANEGIEAFVQALYQKGYAGHRPDTLSDLINTDDDEANKNLSELRQPGLFEFSDAWGNPLVYIRHTDYKKTFTYTVMGENDLEREEVYALQDPEIGYFKFESCQIISLGPDGLFDTDDDVANFDRPE